MIIDFIKWMVGYAEGFEIKNKGITMPNNDFLDSEDIKDNPVYYPLLLQRAIEGYNAKDKKYIFIITNKRIIIVEPESGFNIPENNFNFHDYTSIDEAKEQTLKYIWEQETK